MELPTRNEISLLAYELWKDRGCPAGSPEIDWQRAEEILSSPMKRDVFTRRHIAADLDNSRATH